MDPLSIAAGITALAGATFQIVGFLNTIIDGGKDRLMLFTEVNSLWMVLKLLEGSFDPTNVHHDEAWLQGVHSLAQPGGVFQQISDALQKLNSKLKPRTGRHKALQTLRWPFTDKRDVDENIRHLERLKQSVSLVLNHASLALSQEIRSDGAAVKEAVVSQKLKAVIDWLSPLNFLAKQEAIIKESRDGTGKWLVNSDVFKTWESGDNLILWCPGIPGAGKTFLASIVIKKLRELRRDGSVGVLMLYCSYNDPVTQSVDALISNLIKQVIQEHPLIDQTLEEMHAGHYRKETRPTLHELKNVLGKVLSQYDKAYIMVDGLDELLEEDRRIELLECLRSLQGKVSIMVTSRPLSSISQLFGPPNDEIYCDGCNKKPIPIYYHCARCLDASFDVCQECFDRDVNCQIQGHFLKKRFSSLKIEIEAADEDIQSYVQHRVSREAPLRQCVAKKAGLEDEIIEKVTEFAQGMFLLARFHMDSLATKIQPTSLRKALNNLPTEIDGTYDQAMERIEIMNQDYRHLAKTFLSWVAYSGRALSVREIEHAIAAEYTIVEEPEAGGVDEDDVIKADDLTSMCVGLVTIEAGTVYLVHYTAVNYLDKTKDKWFPNRQTKLAQICISYLMFDAFSTGACSGETEDLDFDLRIKEFPFLGYASLYWGRHARLSDDDELEDMALDLLDRKPHIDASVQALWYTGTQDALEWEAKAGVTALHLASFFGLEAIVPKLLEKNPELNAHDSLGTTPLMYAITEGHDVIVEKLLQAGACVKDIDQAGCNALHRAAIRGNSKVMRVLLNRPEIELNALDPNRSALMLASLYGHTNTVQEMLAKEDLSVNQKSPLTALMLAVIYGHIKVVNLLLKDPRIHINEQDDFGRTALLLAAEEGSVMVVEALLDGGADPEIRDGVKQGGGTPLLRAIDNNHISVVRRLLSRMVDWMSKDRYHRTVIHGAAVNGHDAILRLLLEQATDLDIDAQGSNGRTALHDSAHFGYVECIKILLEFRARIDIKDQWGLTPLKVAKQNNGLEALEILRRAKEKEIGPLKRVDTDASTGEVPLWTAAKLGKKDAIEAAIQIAKTDFEVDLDQLDPTIQRSALHYAASYGHAEIVNMLLEAGVDVNRQDQYGRTPIQLAAEAGLVTITRALLARPIDVNLKDRWGKTALDSAEEYGHWKIAVLLVHNGAMLSEKDRYLHSVLCAAAMYGNSDVVSTLIEAGAEPQRKDEYGMTPFQLAKQSGHDKTAQLLLDQAIPNRSTALIPTRSLSSIGNARSRSEILFAKATTQL